MSNSENQTEGINEHPQEIDDVMAVRRLNQRTRRTGRCCLDVIGQGPCDERRSQIDGDGGKPDHHNAEEDTMRRV